MDLAAGAEKVIVAMEHNDRQGNPKVVQECDFPLTGRGCVSLVVTDVAVLEPTPDGMVLRETAPGWGPSDVQEITGARLIIPETVEEYEV
jgi:3-oxoacid CoA-transferase subunit B